jgi:hypothetical protein
VIAEVAGQGFQAKRYCRILGVAASGCFMWRRRSPRHGSSGCLADGAGPGHPRRLSWHLWVAAGQRRSHQATPLVTNALGMAIHHRSPQPEQTVIHSDHGSQYTSWAFAQRARQSGLLPSRAPSVTPTTTP